MRAGRKRRLGLLAILGVPFLVLGPVAWGDPNDYYSQRVEFCSVDKSGEAEPHRIDELSGLVELEDGDLLVVEDDTAETAETPSALVHVLQPQDGDCAVTDADPLEYLPSGYDPVDIEDIAFLQARFWDPDTVWFADIGDNGQVREEIALIMAPYVPSEDPVTPKVFKLRYPDGPHDAEALLLPRNGTPYIVTKESDGSAGVYRPGAPLDPDNVVVLDKVGEVVLEPTGTRGGPVGRVGQTMVTGGAVSTDGNFLALRTYTEAYVWPMADSDVPTALLSAPLAVTPLPGSPQGEAISFRGNTHSLLVGSEGVDSVLTALTADEAALISDGQGIVGEFQTGGDPELASDSEPSSVVWVLVLVAVVFIWWIVDFFS